LANKLLLVTPNSNVLAGWVRNVFRCVVLLLLLYYYLHPALWFYIDSSYSKRTVVLPRISNNWSYSNWIGLYYLFLLVPLYLKQNKYCTDRPVSFKPPRALQKQHNTVSNDIASTKRERERGERVIRGEGAQMEQ
jgi:hypothetical protein